MGWFDFVKDNNKDDIEVRNENYNALLKSLNTQSPVFLSEGEVLEIPAVQSIIEIVGGTIAQLPVYLYKYNEEDGSVEQVYDDYREFLLNNEPNSLESSYTLKKRIVKDYLLYGYHRLFKETNRNEITALYSLPAETTITKYYENAFKLRTYDISVNGPGGSATLKPDQVISILKDSRDGVTALGALHYGREIFSIVKRESEYQSSIYENGAMPLGILQSAGRLTQSTIDRLRTSWQNLYSGSKNAAKTVILEEGLEYKPVSLNPKDLMINESKKEHISEICRLFNIPESLINSQANKYGSLEQNNISFLQYTLSPIITSIEDSFNKGLLLEDEKHEGYFFAFDTSEVLKSTEKEKYEAIKVGLDSGVVTVNEARSKLNKRPIKDDVMKWSLGAVLYNPNDGSMMIPNMGIGIPGYDKNDINESKTKLKVKQENNDEEEIDKGIENNERDN